MPAKKVLVLSYYNDPNFGDRLGYHLINFALPPDVVVRHATVLPWTVPDEHFDLFVLCIGNSLNAATVRRDELFALVDRMPATVGIFGTQYKEQYSKIMPAERFPALLRKLTVWFARYEEDIRVFGQELDNVRHLGDWLIHAFPLAQWTNPGMLTVPPDIKRREAPLDRVIQRIQAYRKVSSARLHPLLCALTSAEEVSYKEQFEDPYGENSGKFRAMLLDVFGKEYPPEAFFAVDRAAVAAYKAKVAENYEALRKTLAALLEG